MLGATREICRKRRCGQEQASFETAQPTRYQTINRYKDALSRCCVFFLSPVAEMKSRLNPTPGYRNTDDGQTFIQKKRGGEVNVPGTFFVSNDFMETSKSSIRTPHNSNIKTGTKITATATPNFNPNHEPHAHHLQYNHTPTITNLAPLFPSPHHS